MMKKLYVLIVGLLFFGAGCQENKDSFSYSNNISLVVALCHPVTKGQRLVFQIDEVWRDESNGLFTLQIGDCLDNVPVYDEKVHGAIFFWALNEGSLFCHSQIYIYDGVVYNETKMSIEEAKQIVLNSKPQYFDLKLSERPHKVCE